MIEEARDLDRLNKGQEALPLYEKYLEVRPGDAGAWSDYGGLLMVLGRLDEAQKACNRALRMDPVNPGAMVGSGCILMRRGRLAEAEGFFRKVLVRDPRRMDARLALAECLIRNANPDQARVELGKAIAQDPGNPTAHQYLGHIFHMHGLWSEYQEEIRRYLQMDPASAYVEYEQGFLDLLFGNMASGWQGFEARFKLAGLVGPERHFTEPRWKGESFVDRTLLLHYEQGFGDTLMFVRFAPQVKARGGRVVLAAQAQLADLVATCRGIDEVVPHGAPFPPFDLQLPLMSLPLVLETGLTDIPADIPYLDLPERIPNQAGIAGMLASSLAGIRVGFAWTGSPHHKNDFVRSIPLPALEALTALSGITWFSFQLGVEKQPPFPGLRSFAPLLSNFSDTAYALSGMDLVISVDTALAHLAGAMGIPTFLLLPFSPDWRWLLGREDSPWYPSLRIYRQPVPGDWDSVLQRVISDLTGEE
jgi:Tfp pilus assembly protein PilF